MYNSNGTQALCNSSCANCAEKELSLFAQLEEDDLNHLGREKKVVNYSAGEVIYKEGSKSNSLLCLKRGKVKITKRGIDGTEQIIDLKKPVDFVGFEAIFGQGYHQNSAVALDECTICHIDKIHFIEVVKRNGSLSLKVIETLASYLDNSNRRLVNLTQKHMRGRMAEALLLVMEVYGTDGAQNILNVQLKRAELAAIANMTTSNAIRILSSFSKENLIATRQRQIRLINPAELMKISEQSW